MGKFDERDGFLVLMDGMDIFAREHEIALFERVVDDNILEINKKLEAVKTLKRISLIKMITFPVEYLLDRILLPRQWSKLRYQEFLLCIRLLRNKLSYDEFNKSYYKLQGDALK